MGNGEKFQALEDLWEVSRRRVDGALPVDRHTKATDIDSLVASEMNKMSLDERERRLEELHGIVEEDEKETPEFIAEKLAAMEIAIRNIVEKSAYLQALSMNRSYVEDPKFRLMFLRSDRYDPERAAARIVFFMEKKRKLFGADSMVRSLTLKDLDKDDMHTLRNGHLQILPVRDRAGRMVIVDTHLTGPKLYSTDMSCVRIYIYTILHMMEDEDSQKHGIVHLMYYMEKPRFSEERDKEFGKEIVDSDRWLPFRSAAIHMCCSLPVLNFIFHALKVITVPEKRTVTRIHEGTHLEVQYRLLSFGIPVESLFINADGSVKTTVHRKWIARQQEREDNIATYGSNFGRIDFPTNRDVLIGKGKTIQDHISNVQLRQWIQQVLGGQTSLTRARKAELCQQVLSHVLNEKKGRFLTKGANDWWLLASQTEARDRIRKMIANILYNTKQQQRRQLAVAVLPVAKRQRVGDSPCIDMPCNSCLPRHGVSGVPVGMTKMGP